MVCYIVLEEVKSAGPDLMPSQRNKIKILLRLVFEEIRSFYDKASCLIRQVLGKFSGKFRSRHPRDDEWA